jgi:hypothetical protein
MESKSTNLAIQEFQQVHGIISLHRNRALHTVNNENLLLAWEVGSYVSARLKNSAWGSKTVMQLSEYLRTQDPTLKGYSRRNIYNMVSFYEAYSNAQFIEYHDRNHFEIINTCKTIEEKFFYVLYSYKERLNINELRRCLKNHTFASLMSDKHNLSNGLKELYPQAAPMLKDTLFVDFLGLTQKHS